MVPEIIYSSVIDIDPLNYLPMPQAILREIEIRKDFNPDRLEKIIEYTKDINTFKLEE
jgi:hypothetical protein